MCTEPVRHSARTGSPLSGSAHVHRPGAAHVPERGARSAERHMCADPLRHMCPDREPAPRIGTCATTATPGRHGPAAQRSGCPTVPRCEPAGARRPRHRPVDTPGRAGPPGLRPVRPPPGTRCRPVTTQHCASGPAPCRPPDTCRIARKLSTLQDAGETTARTHAGGRHPRHARQRRHSAANPGRAAGGDRATGARGDAAADRRGRHQGGHARAGGRGGRLQPRHRHAPVRQPGRAAGPRRAVRPGQPARDGDRPARARPAARSSSARTSPSCARWPRRHGRSCRCGPRR